MTKGNEYSAMKRAYGKTSKLYFLSLARSLRSEFISDSSSSHTQCIFEFSGRKLSRYGRVVKFYRKYAHLVSLRNWVTLDDMIRGASEISSGKYSTIVDVHGSGEVYRELGLAISSYLGIVR